MERLIKAMNKYLSDAKKKVLTLTVCKEWFDMISEGRKTEEYRVPKSYWIKRLLAANSDNTDMKSWAEAVDGRVDIIRQSIRTNFVSFKPYTLSSSSTATVRIVHELRRRLRVSPSASQRKAYVPTSGLILSFSSLNSNSV